MIRRPTWVLLAVFLLLLVAVLVTQADQIFSSGDPTPTSGIDFLINTQGRMIVRLQISSKDGEQVELMKNRDGMWQLLNQDVGQTDTSRVESGISTIERIRVLSRLETNLDKKIIGLDPAENKLELEFENGEKTIVFIGNLTPTGGYYAQTEADQLVVVDSFSIDNLIEYFVDPPILRTPTPEPIP